LIKLHHRTSRRLVSACLFTLIFTLTQVRTHAQSADAEPAKPQNPPVQPANPDQPPANPDQTVVKEDKRVFGVFPNYRTTENSIPFAPITSKQKFLIGLKDSFDWPVYPVAGAFSALYQLENQNPSFGQGMAGYARRYGTALADQVIGNMMTESIMPSLLHQDPRYFRLGTGSIGHRTVYALTRIIICRTDSGARAFNFSEFLGNSAAVAIGNAYYPDTRDVSDNVQRLGVALATDAFSQVLKEFWPDVKRRLFHRHDAPMLSTGMQAQPVAVSAR
jgi:hypothetical protein